MLEYNLNFCKTFFFLLFLGQLFSQSTAQLFVKTNSNIKTKNVQKYPNDVKKII